MVIRRVSGDLEECAGVIRKAFITVADEFHLTKENAPTNPAFLGADSLEKMRSKGAVMFGAYENETCIGFVAAQKANEDTFYMERLAVLPEYRHGGIGRKLMDTVFEYVKENGGKKVSIGIINENTRLKNWYIQYGFIETGRKHFEHLPFEVCFMERAV
jgi:ribosomal protein S18 acetylase RimI-like enzyme